MKAIPTLLIITFLFVALIGIGDAFSLEKSLVQLEVDENYPCHIENGDEIVCPPIDNNKIKDWKDKIDALPSTEKDKGKLKDTEKKAYLNEKIVPYERKGQSKTLKINEEYREKIKIYDLSDDEQIRIGFATNVFGLGGIPLENFDTNFTTGLIRYRPLNMTWLFTNGNATSQGINTFSSSETNLNINNFTISIWAKLNDKITNNKPQNLVGDPDFGSWVAFGNGTSGSEQVVFVMTNDINHIQTENITLNRWYHIAFVHNKTDCFIYLNGIFNTSNSCADITATGSIRIGSFTAEPTNTSIDEVRIYKRILSASEILEIYNSGRVPNNTLSNSNLLFWYPVNEFSGRTINDRNNLTRSGNLVGTPIWQSDNLNVSTLGYDVNISIVNITSAFMYWDNGTIINQSFTGNKTFTFYNNQSIFILENFPLNITEGVTPLQYYPFNMTVNNSNYKAISSLIDGVFNTTIQVNVAKCDIKSLTLTPKFMTTYSPPYTCSGTNALITGALLNKSSSSNEINISYYYPGLDISYPSPKTYRQSETQFDLKYWTNDTANCKYSLDGWLTNSSAVTAGTNWTGLTANLGSNTWYVACLTSGNTEVSDSIVFNFQQDYQGLQGTFLRILIGFLALGVTVIGIGGFMYYVYNNFSDIKPDQILTIAIVIIIGLVLIGVLINYIWSTIV